MKGIVLRVEGMKLTIEIDLTRDFGPTIIGRTNIVATTSGFEKLDEIEKGLSLNQVLYRRVK